MATMGKPIDTVRQWYRMRDPDLLAPDIRWEVLKRFPMGGLYEGRQHVIDDFFSKISATFAEFRADVEEMWDTERGEVVAIGDYIARVSPKDPEITSRFAHIWTVESGKIVRFRQVADTAAFAEVLQ